VFKSYPSGVRFVEFTHGGQDTKNWAGHFGVKMTNPAVFVGQKIGNKNKRVRPVRVLSDNSRRMYCRFLLKFCFTLAIW